MNEKESVWISIYNEEVLRACVRMDFKEEDILVCEREVKKKENTMKDKIRYGRDGFLQLK